MSSRAWKQLAVLVVLSGLVGAPARARSPEPVVPAGDSGVTDPLFEMLDPAADPDRLGWEPRLANTPVAALGVSLDTRFDLDPEDAGDFGDDLASPSDRGHAVSDSLDTRAVPVPQPALLTGLGLVGLAFYGRRR